MKHLADMLATEIMSNTKTVTLTIMSGPDDGTRMTLQTPKRGDVYTFGRLQECDVILPYDSQISRNHACLLWIDDKWYLQDQKSRNGTFIGKQRIEGTVPIETGQMFRMGRTWVRLEPGSNE